MADGQLVKALVHLTFGERGLDVVPGTHIYAPLDYAEGWRAEGYVEFMDELKLPQVFDIDLQPIDWPIKGAEEPKPAKADKGKAKTGK